jgi:hypothetical protein
LASLTRRVSFSRRAVTTSGERSGAGKTGEICVGGEEGNDVEELVEAEVEREDEADERDLER